LTSNSHGYRTKDIRPQLRKDPRERVQPAVVLKRKNEKSESGMVMTEFKTDNLESHDTDFALSSHALAVGPCREHASGTEA